MRTVQLISVCVERLRARSACDKGLVASRCDPCSDREPCNDARSGVAVMKAFWDWDSTREYLSFETEQDALDDYINTHKPEVGVVVTLSKFAQMKAKASAERYLEILLEDLDEEYADPNMDGTAPNLVMRKAAETFVATVINQYQVWACEVVDIKDMKLVGYPAQWVEV